MMKIAFTMLSMLLWSSSSFSMQHEENGLIEFGREKKTLWEWVGVSKKNDQHPFSTTYVVRYVMLRDEKYEFIKKGDILSLDEQDFNDIARENYVYRSYYKMQQTRLSPHKGEPVGVVIVGTKDTEAFNKLYLGSAYSAFKRKEN